MFGSPGSRLWGRDWTEYWNWMALQSGLIGVRMLGLHPHINQSLNETWLQEGGMTLGKTALSNSDNNLQKENLWTQTQACGNQPSQQLWKLVLQSKSEILSVSHNPETTNKIVLNFPIWVKSGLDLASLREETSIIPSSRTFTYLLRGASESHPPEAFPWGEVEVVSQNA